MKNNQFLLQTAFAKFWSLPSLTNHVATKDNPADAGTRGVSAEFLQLSSWVKGPHLLSKSSFPLAMNKYVIKNVNQAITIEDTVSLATSVKNRQLPFRRYSHLVNLVLLKSTCALLHTCSDFCRNIPATVTLMVALLTLLSLTKSGVISSTCCMQSPLKPEEKIFLIKNLLNGAAKWLHIQRSLVQVG